MIQVLTRDNLDEFGRMFERYWKLTGLARKEALFRSAGNFAGFAVQGIKAKVTHPKGFIRRERMAGFKRHQGLQISDRARMLVYKKFGVSGGAVNVHVKGAKANPTFMTGAGKRGLSKAQIARVSALSQAFESTRSGRKGKGPMTLQALLSEKELQLREAHRAFTSAAMLFPGMKHKDRKGRWIEYSHSSTGQKLGVAGLMKSDNNLDEVHFMWGALGKYSRMAAAGLSHPRTIPVLNDALKKTRADMLVYIQKEEDKAARAAARNVRRLLR